MNNPTVIFLVGVPCSGKSSWVKTHNNTDMTVVSSDDIIEQYAKSVNKTYSEVFKDYVKTADVLFKQKLQYCIESNKSIIIDRTNLTKKSRVRLLNLFPKHYTKICVIFNTDIQTITDRLTERNKSGKFISYGLLDAMRNSYTQPTLEEGFDEIFVC